MPLFEFECQRCGNRTEQLFANVEQADSRSVWCRSPQCKPAKPGGVCLMLRVPHAANFALKGAGFHCVDYPKGK